MSSKSRKREEPKPDSVRDEEPRYRIGKALGASRSLPVETEPHGPFGVVALAREIQARLVSSGGRPADSAPTLRRQVPIRKSVWRALQRRAALTSARGRRVSAGPLAALLVERGLERLEENEESDDHAG